MPPPPPVPAPPPDPDPDPLFESPAPVPDPAPVPVPPDPGASSSPDEVLEVVVVGLLGAEGTSVFGAVTTSVEGLAGILIGGGVGNFTTSGSEVVTTGFGADGGGIFQLEFLQLLYLLL